MHRGRMNDKCASLSDKDKVDADLIDIDKFLL